MTCSDVEKLLPEILDGAPDSAYQTAFDLHLKSCPDCSDLVSDLKLITNEAQFLTATDEPAPRVWVNISNQLRAEGLIREPAPVPGRPGFIRVMSGLRRSAWWLAPVAVALLAAGSYVVSHKATQVAKQQTLAVTGTTPAPDVASAPDSHVVDATANPVENPVEKTAAASSAATPVPDQASQSAEVAKSTLEAAPSPEDQQFLRAVSTRAPSMRAAYEDQLQVVNRDIRETQLYVDQNPRDMDARQHLMDAYQQKALLYQIALDRIQ